MDAPVADGQEPQITQTNCLFVFCRNKCNPFLLKKQRVKEQVSQYKHVAYISYPSIHRKKERKEISISFSQQEHCTFIFSFSPSCNRVLQTYKPPFPLPRLPMKGGLPRVGVRNKIKLSSAKPRLCFRSSSNGKKQPEKTSANPETQERKKEHGKHFRFLTKKRISEIIRSHKKAHHGDGHHYLFYGK